MECLDAVRRTRRKFASSEEQDVGLGREEKSLSVSSVKESQSARLKLRKVLSRLGCLVSLSGAEMRMGRWSDWRVVRVCQESAMARWAEQMDRSGDVGWPLAL